MLTGIAVAMGIIMLGLAIFLRLKAWSQDRTVAALKATMGGRPVALRGLDAATLDAFEGATVVVTGATAGLGYEAAKAYAVAAGGDGVVIVHGRTQASAQAAVGRMAADLVADNQGSSHGRLVAFGLDLSDIGAAHGALASLWSAERETLDGRGIDVVCANAAFGFSPQRVVTGDGLEACAATNHLGHMALIEGARSLLAKARTQARVVVVSSGLANRVKAFDPDDMFTMAKAGAYDANGRAAYNNSKLLNLLYATAFSARAEGANPGLAEAVAVAVHPGVSATTLSRRSKWKSRFIFNHIVCVLLGHPPAQACAPLVHAGIVTDLPPPATGAPVLYCGFNHGDADLTLKPESINPIVTLDLADRVWEASAAVIERLR